ncbi:protein FAM177A1-like [Amphiura filiformis]|uniref:protein FAM177A1-like n=1 Tax=Amphiura filiformis TaxID=82378 RepID=UPI003B20FD17
MASNLMAVQKERDEVSGSQVFLVENEQHPECDPTEGPATISTSTDQPKPVKEFESVDLSKGEKKRVPKRVIHFSDGIMEEYSTDEEDGGDDEPSEPQVDPKTLAWVPYLWYYFLYASTSTLSACDFVGEKLAYMLGITSPKYQYAISEYNRLMDEEKKELEMLEKKRDRKKETIAEKEAMRVFAKSSGNTSNPGLAADL